MSAEVLVMCCRVTSTFSRLSFRCSRKFAEKRKAKDSSFEHQLKSPWTDGVL